MDGDKKDDENFFEKHKGNIVLWTIGTIFTLYLVYSWYFPEKMPDCGYSNMGCQGDTRWGQ